MMKIKMTLMISMVVTAIKQAVVEAAGVLKFSKNLGATSKF
jgi:hypothetical protein